MQSSRHIRNLTLTALLSALCCLFTVFLLHIPVGNGYIHLGDTVIYLAACLVPFPYASLVGIIGGGLSDLITAPVWVIPTVIIKALLPVAFSCSSGRILTRRNVGATCLAGLITVVGYYLAQGLLFGWEAALITSVPGNLLQSLGSGLCFLALGRALDRTHIKDGLR